MGTGERTPPRHPPVPLHAPCARQWRARSPASPSRRRSAAPRLGGAGPMGADTVSVRAMKGEFDAVLAAYHDVGMTAVKVAGFGKGVNVTLGLPFPRTAPDHGTALDIAGKGVADPSSMRAALDLAVELAKRNRKP